ncbi:MAG: type II toxin-antitoxin system HicB family antitoxin [Candidatus Kapabacteria bacterium]|nr:type II toxin-antitoxin system HicB family antitoxin [Candidatus Kapabacteria bacterium]
MAQTFTAAIQQRDDWWIGWIEEIPGVNCQERTKGELLETLRITLLEVVELNRQYARAAAGPSFEEIIIHV